MDWRVYIEHLQLDSLWNLQTESALKGKSFAVNDGSRYILEFCKDNNYKYLCYTAPDLFKHEDINHKKFQTFMEQLIEPVIYHRTRNPK